jgi:hypothetical protein
MDGFERYEWECGASPRLRRLFAVALGRRAWDRLIIPEIRAAVEVSERYADGQASEDERLRAFAAAGAAAAAQDEMWPWVYQVVAADDTTIADPEVAFASYHWELASDRAAEGAAMTELWDDIFGIPDRLMEGPRLESAWLSPTALSLARRIYAERAFDRLPTLAERLEEAGCGREQILAHCRSPGLHARGCWVVDLLLGNA